MNPDLREVKMTTAPTAKTMEYAVHGLFKKPKVEGVELANGVCGCWYVPLKKLVKNVGKEDLKPILDTFEHDLKEAREESIEGLGDDFSDTDDSDSDDSE